jgi:uncharacterized protein (TIGR02996 family)
MNEDGFLNVLRADPNDEATRLVYADWLDERGDPRAAFIRLESEYVSLSEEDVRLAEMKDRLFQMAALLSEEWLRVVSRPAIELCELRFAYTCPKRWDRLKPTGDSSIRFCEGCQQNVYYCGTVGDARGHARRGHCVAVDLGQSRQEGDLEVHMMTMGIIDPNWREGLPRDPEIPEPNRRRGKRR